MPSGAGAEEVMKRARPVERAIAAVLEAKAENDTFNPLLGGAGLKARDVVLFRAWFRYLRQTGLTYGLVTVVEAVRRAPSVARNLIALFDAQHDPAHEGGREAMARQAEEAITDGLAQVSGIDEDRILRLFRGVVSATPRTNAYAEYGREALAFKLDSPTGPSLPAPVPRRVLWGYIPPNAGRHRP